MIALPSLSDPSDVERLVEGYRRARHQGRLAYVELRLRGLQTNGAAETEQHAVW